VELGHSSRSFLVFADICFFHFDRSSLIRFSVNLLSEFGAFHWSLFSQGQKCKGMEGLVEEGSEIMAETVFYQDYIPLGYAALFAVRS
jgi:hypothetical protein